MRQPPSVVEALPRSEDTGWGTAWTSPRTRVWGCMKLGSRLAVGAPPRLSPHPECEVQRSCRGDKKLTQTHRELSNESCELEHFMFSKWALPNMLLRLMVILT